MQWNSQTREITFRVPHWAEVLAGLRQRHWARFLLFIIILNTLMGYVDQPLAEWVKSNVSGGFLSFSGVVTQLGNSRYWLVPIAFLLPFLIASWQAVSDRSVRRMIAWGIAALVFLFLCIALSGILVNILKPLFGRARPDMWFSNGFYGFLPFGSGDGSGWNYSSFPSGHAATAFSLATALACLVTRGRLWLFLLAAPIALSRVAVSAHYLSDVIAGGAIGWWVSVHIRDFFLHRGWVFVRRGGECRIRAPGQLLFASISARLPDMKDRAEEDDDMELVTKPSSSHETEPAGSPSEEKADNKSG